MDIQEILFILKKHFVMIIAISVIFAISSAVISKYLITPLYESDTSIIVNPGQNVQSNTVTYDQVNTVQQLTSTYSLILKSDTVLDQVIKNLNLNTTYQKLEKNVTVSGVNQSEVIQISVKDPDPEKAAYIANEITKVAPDVIIRTVKAGSVDVVSSAKPSKNPVSPNVLLNVGIAFVAGIVISVLISFLIELLDRSFSSDDDVRKNLGLTVIGIIPRVEMKA